MKRFAMMALTALACASCSVPDGDDLSRLKSTVAGWSDATLTRVLNYAMNRRAIEWLEQRNPNDEVGKVLCYRDDNSLVEVAVRTVDDVIVCLLAHPELLYVQCVDMLNDRAATIANGDGKAALEEKFKTRLSQCFAETSFRYKADHVDDPLVTDPEAWEDEDVARALISMPGPLPGGPVPGLFPVLCPLAEDPDSWGCPGSPDYPPGETPEPSDEGDR